MHEVTLSGEVKRILTLSKKEKGEEFEVLLAQELPCIPTAEIEECWRWRDLPEQLHQEVFPGTDRRDTGIDLVARNKSGQIIAIQCKAYNESSKLSKKDSDSFLALTGHKPGVHHRWIVTTASWTDNLANGLTGCSLINPIDLWGTHIIDRPNPDKKTPDDIQQKAIRDCVRGLSDQGHDRGILVLACGLGKTLVSQWIAEELTETDESPLVLYATPSISLTAQSRREWLANYNRSLRTLVVCSDQEAGRGGQVSESPVTTDHRKIRELLLSRKRDGSVTAVFCTYQSIERICLAQEEKPDESLTFHLAIADEAHRTTGAFDKDGPKMFQQFHKRLQAAKRLYQTATPRVYSRRSKETIDKSTGKSTEEVNVQVVDMGDKDIYGPFLHQTSFRKALDAGSPRLCDYKVVVALTHKNHDADRIHERTHEKTQNGKPIADLNIGARTAALALTMFGVSKADEIEIEPIPLHACIAYTNTLQRARWVKNVLSDPQVSEWARARQSKMDSTVKLTSGCIEGKNTATERLAEMEHLEQARQKKLRHVTTNCKVLGEGINVPTLDAIAILEEKSSEIDIIQAVGRVLRKPANGDKNHGYLIVPVVIESQKELFEENLAQWSTEWRILGKVLRALRAHDPEINTDFHKRVSVTSLKKIEGGRGGNSASPAFIDKLQRGDFDALFTAIHQRSGIQPDARETAEEIHLTVKRAARALHEDGLGVAVAQALEIQLSENPNERIVDAGKAATQAALLMCLATIVHKRMEAEFSDWCLTPMDTLRTAPNGAKDLERSWKFILDKDFAPIFEPPLKVLQAMRRAGNDSQGLCRAIQTLCEKADDHADEYAACGEDRAGELFQKGLQDPASSGAFYTKPSSATLLAELTCDALASKESSYWNGTDLWKNRRIVDPACGSGTLLTAMKAAILRRVDLEKRDEIGRILVEDTIVGLDINWQALQLAATQLTINALSANHSQIGLYRMPHGRTNQKNIFVEGDSGSVGLGSIEILAQFNKRQIHPELQTLTQEASIRPKHTGVRNDQDIAGIEKLLKNTAVMIANPPWTVGSKVSRTLNSDVRSEQQTRWNLLKKSLDKTELNTQIVETDSIRPRFTLLMEHYSDRRNGVLAQVLPSTALLGVGGHDERNFLLDRYDVLHVLSVHNPGNYSWANSGFQESLVVMKRKSHTGNNPKVSFVNLAQLPDSSRLSIEISEAIRKNNLEEKGSLVRVSQDSLRSRGWFEVLYYSSELSRMASKLEDHLSMQEHFSRLGTLFDCKTTKETVGKKNWEWCDPAEAEIAVLRGAGKDVQTAILGTIDGWSRRTSSGMKKRTELELLKQKTGCLLVANAQNAMSGRLTSVVLSIPAVGYAWTPVQCSQKEAMRHAVWLNSIVGRIQLRNRIGRDITFPMYQPDSIKDVYLPSRLTSESKETLDDALERTRDMKVGMYREGAGEAHRIWDRAAAAVMQWDYKTLKRMRDLLDREPTVCGRLPTETE